MNFKFYIYFGLVVLLFHFSVSCERPTSSENANQSPNTTLANIPVDGDTIFALATLHWDGEDNDGFIMGYEYRYITNHLFYGDSVVQEWKFTTKPSLTIPFESSDDMNYQTFQVRAIDNLRNVDPSPAQRYFYTPKTIFPVTEILFPASDQQFFVIDQTTDWWTGIKLAFTAQDQDGEVVEYAWSVDGDTAWTWTNDTLLYIPPDKFSSLVGEHVIRVTSRDNTNLVDPLGDSVIVELIQPSFRKDILIIDETAESRFPFGVNVTDAEVDSFYARIFKTHDIWNYYKDDGSLTIKDGMPPKSVLGQYKMIIWHADNVYTTENDNHRLPRHQEEIMDYMNVGGDFIMSGWRILKSFAPNDPFPRAFNPGEFIHDYLHITFVNETSLIGDFIGATGVGDFDPVYVDPAKIPEFPYTGKLAQINFIPGRAGFTDAIYLYENDLATGNPQYRSWPVGIRYYGTVFDAVVLGFPVYFLDLQSAEILGEQVLKSMGYN
jgi:hypothetical protein